MNETSKAIVERMFAAFSEGNVEKILETISYDSLWIYHGTQIIPKSEYKGKEGARKFFTGIINYTEIIHFTPKQFIVQGNMVVVLGNEHQRVKKSGKELKQEWVQIYTVNNNLITRMEEFASSEIL